MGKLGRFCSGPKSHKVLYEQLATAMLARVCEETGVNWDSCKANINQVTGKGVSWIDPESPFANHKQVYTTFVKVRKGHE